MYATTQYPDLISIFRFDGDVAVPAAMITLRDSFLTYPPNQPTAQDGSLVNAWTWTDPSTTGVPSFTAASFTPVTNTGNNTFITNNPGHVGGWWMEPEGNIWVTISGQSDQGNSIFRFKLESFSSNGAPVYDTWATATGYAIPALSGPADPTPVPLSTAVQKAFFYNPPTDTGNCTYPPVTLPTFCSESSHDLCVVRRAIYDEVYDVMYLSGYTNTDIIAGLNCGVSPQSPGPTVIRYAHWSGVGGTRSVGWKSALPYIHTTSSSGYLSLGFIETLTLPLNDSGGAGDWLFAGYAFDVDDETGSSPNTAYTSTVLAIATGTGLSPNGTAPGTEPNSPIQRSSQLLGNNTGVLDTPFGVMAHLRATGEYDLFTEDDALGKVIFMGKVITTP